MGASYSILPLIPPVEDYYQDLNEWLADFGFQVPVDATSRYPTPAEIRQVLDEMPEYTKDYSITEKHWDVDVYETALYDPKRRRIDGKHTSIYSVGPALNESLPLHIYFRGGWEELNLEITLGLTRIIGPVLLMADFDAVPVFISPEERLSDLVDQWNKNREFRDTAL